MVNDGLESPYSPKERRLSIVQTSEIEAVRKAYPVDWDCLQGMVVESTVSKRDIYIMMHRMNMLYRGKLVERWLVKKPCWCLLTVEPFIYVECPMGEVLKRICKNHG